MKSLRVTRFMAKFLTLTARAKNAREDEATMPLSREEVLHVALLARLELSEEEIERYTWELNRVLEHIEKLKELDTEGVEPTSHAVPLSNVFRPDEPGEPLPREEVLMNAPDAVDGYFRVPRVVEES